jgi:hypothetical protein
MFGSIPNIVAPLDMLLKLCIPYIIVPTILSLQRPCSDPAMQELRKERTSLDMLLKLCIPYSILPTAWPRRFNIFSSSAETQRHESATWNPLANLSFPLLTKGPLAVQSLAEVYHRKFRVR